MRDDMGTGIWSHFGTNSEWAPLRQVELALPPSSWPAPEDWNAALYLAPVDFSRLADELTAYGEALRSLGVEVNVSTLEDSSGVPPQYNAIFMRDQFAPTPNGAIIARMASPARALEARQVSSRLAAGAYPILRTVAGDGVFEGADMLWTSPTGVVIGVGKRTSRGGAAQVAETLRGLGVRVRMTAVPANVQHLLGIVQIVSHDLALVRVELAPPSLLQILQDEGLQIVPVPELASVTSRQAFNFVTVASRTIVMPEGSDELLELYARAGLTVAAEIRCDELIKCAGGLACATGIARRDMVGIETRSP